MADGLACLGSTSQHRVLRTLQCSLRVVTRTGSAEIFILELSGGFIPCKTQTFFTQGPCDDSTVQRSHLINTHDITSRPSSFLAGRNPIGLSCIMAPACKDHCRCNPMHVLRVPVLQLTQQGKQPYAKVLHYQCTAQGNTGSQQFACVSLYCKFVAL